MLYRDYLKNKYQNTAVKLANAEGVPCVLEYSKGKNMRNYEVYGNSVQDGTPSPESPVDIQSVGDLVTDTKSEYYGKYDIPITVTGTRSETMHIYLDEPLRKVGDYADYIDFKNQKVVRKVKELTLDGTETWYKGTTMADTIAFYIKPNNILNLSNQYSILSDKFIIKSSGVSSIDNEFAQNTGINVYFKINKSRLNSETIDEMKAWVTANNIQLYYILAIPTEETISLPALKTFKGTNIMTVDTAVLPSNIKAKYIRT